MHSFVSRPLILLLYLPAVHELFDIGDRRSLESRPGVAQQLYDPHAEPCEGRHFRGPWGLTNILGQSGHMLVPLSDVYSNQGPLWARRRPLCYGRGVCQVRTGAWT